MVGEKKDKKMLTRKELKLTVKPISNTVNIFLYRSFVFVLFIYFCAETLHLLNPTLKENACVFFSYIMHG